METYKTNPEHYEEISELLKALSHPVRLCIVRGLLENGTCNVTDMQNCLKAPQSTISQHISKLKSCGIIKGEKRGLEIYYSVTSKKAAELIKILFD